jgi:asparagine synthase (glutamine-hydrolysing)
MCGIAGIFYNSNGHTRSPSRGAAEAMASTLAHRGPDDAGVWESADGLVALAHRRLSIVDLSPLGRNPMSWDGRLWITFNGEIYNFRELRSELEASGCRFRSQTDTEVILAAYDTWGTDSVHRFAGMFAFALWDEPRRRLWVVRDRLGKKPLYYVHHDGAFRFASELKALASDRAVPLEIDREALKLYLRYGYVPAPFSIYRAIRKLPPGHEATVETGTLRVREYWNPAAFTGAHAGITADEAEQRLEALLSTAVRQRRVADVPLGSFLSGGIDSSLIVAMMQEQSAEPVKTFTIRFDNPQFDEADHAAAVARHLGTEHHEETCSSGQMLEVVDRIPAMYDEPFADSSAIPTFIVSRMARQHVTVALSGDGGDELFFGYPRYSHYLDSGWALGLPAPVRKFAAAIAARAGNRRVRRIADVLREDDRDRYTRFVSWMDGPHVTEFTGDEASAAPIYTQMLARVRELTPGDHAPLLDVVSYLPDDILAKVDRASMAVSLEVRAPLLDHRVAEFAIGLPLTLKRRNGETKWLLRRMLARRIPRHLTDRPKMGFGVPLVDWFRGPLRAQMSSYCAGSDFEDLGLNPAPARRLWSSFNAGGAVRPDLLWQMFSLAAWARSRRLHGR